MNADEKDLLHRHLNGDLDASEQAAFLSRLQSSPELRRALASHALDETLLSELVLEGRTAARPPARRRTWIPVSIAAGLLVGLALMLTPQRRLSPPSVRIASIEGAATLGGRPLQQGQEVRPGDTIQTSRGTVMLEGEGIRFEIGSNSSLEMWYGKGTTGFRTDKGTVRAVIASRSAVTLGSPHGSVDASSATLRMEVGFRRTRIEVEKGAVDQARGSVPAGRFISFDMTEIETGRLVDRASLDLAVRRGCEFLESRRSEIVAPMSSEKRHASQPRRTYAELALLALHRAGYPDSHALKAELLGLVQGRTVESTYVAALQAMALAEIDPVAHHERIRYCAQLLVDSQCVNGQWDYAVKLALPDVPATGRIKRRAEGPPSGDNSGTAYAVLGLHACSRAGVDIDPDVLTRARTWWLQCQNPDGGWGYNDSGKRDANDGQRRTYTTNASYGSATASGVAALAALCQLREEDGRANAAVLRGLEWLAGSFAADHNPRKDAGFLAIHWLAAAARAGQLVGTERFGGHEWYGEGAEHLLKTQRPSGEWAGEQGEFMNHEKNDVLDTCLAILFLRRAP